MLLLSFKILKFPDWKLIKLLTIYYMNRQNNSLISFKALKYKIDGSS